MKPRTKTIINIVATAIPSAMIVMSGIMKFAAPPEMLEGFTKMGIAQYMPLLGIMEIGFTLLFIFPRTMRLGFILLSCYFAGAIATELVMGMPFNALLPMGLLWIGAFIRDRSVFFSPAHRVAAA